MTAILREEIRAYAKPIGDLSTATDRLALVALAILALVPRLYRLGAQSLWFDEAQTLIVAQFPWAEIVQRAYRPPLYHFGLHIWSALVPNSEFWLRLPSALLGILIPPLLYAIAVQLYDRRVAWTAGLLAVASPTLIAYAQELRMYSLMAAAFALLLYLMVIVVQSPSPPRIGLWIAISLTTVVSLYTHYFAIPFLLCTAALMALTLALQRRWQLLRAWVAVQLAAAVAFVPWLLVIRAGRGGTEDYIGAEVLPVLPEVPGVRAFVARIWLFYTTGPVTSELPLVRQLAMAGALLLAGATLVLVVGLALDLWARWRRHEPLVNRQRLGDLWLLTLVGLTIGGAMFMYYMRPGVVHPRHLMMLAVPLLLLAARVTGPALAWVTDASYRRWSRFGTRLLAGAALVVLTLLFVTSHHQAVYDPSLQRADVRAMAQEVASRSTPETIVLLPHHDYALEHYMADAAPVYHLETRVGDQDLLAWALPRIQGAERAILIDWVHLHQDPRDLISWFLQSNGRLVERFWSAERWVSVYDLEPALAAPTWEASDLRTDAVRLRGFSLPGEPTTDQTLAIGLEWELLQRTPRDLKASVRLMDPSGHVVAADDRVLLAEQATVGTSRWSPGRTARNYYLLALPAGTPPVNYVVQLSVYDANGALPFVSPDGSNLGTVVSIGEQSLLPPTLLPTEFDPDTGLVSVEQELAPGLLLEGYALETEAPRAGETVAVTLYWRALAQGLPSYEPALLLVSQEGHPLGEQRGGPADGRYATSLWRSGELVIDRRLLRVSPDAQAGPADILLAVEGNAITLLETQIRESDRLYELPFLEHTLDVSLGGVARLAGYHVEGRVRADESLKVTLYWEALHPESGHTDYVVFVHLIGEGETIIAQHDGMPAGGEWPTTTWLSGQIIMDDHTLRFHDAAYQGAATLAVGMYDAATWQRLATLEGEDRILLPASVIVE